jgi:hypothetical protein
MMPNSSHVPDGEPLTELADRAGLNLSEPAMEFGQALAESRVGVGAWGPVELGPKCRRMRVRVDRAKWPETTSCRSAAKGHPVRDGRPPNTRTRPVTVHLDRPVLSQDGTG